MLDSVGRDAENRPATAGPEGDSKPTGGKESCTLPVAKEAVVLERPPAFKPIKLEKYDGVSVPFETFVAKLNNAVLFNRWSETEKCAFLRDALVADASHGNCVSMRFRMI